MEETTPGNDDSKSILTPAVKPVSQPLSAAGTDGSIPPSAEPNSIQGLSFSSRAYNALKDYLPRYISGLLLLITVAALIGFTFNESFLQASWHAYFGELTDAFNFVIGFVPVFLAFLLVGLATASRHIVLYPIVAYILSGPIRDTALTKLLANSLPFSTGSKPGHTVYFSAVILSFVVAYVLIKPFYYLNINRHINDNDRAVRLAVILVSVGGMAILCALFLWAPGAYERQQAQRAIVHYAVGSTYATSKAGVYYDETLKTTSNEQHMDTLEVSPQKEWWNKNVKRACGTGVNASRGDGAYSAYEAKKTPGGLNYVVALTDENGSQPALPQYAFKRYTYCFIIGAQQYRLERESYGGDAHLKAVSAETLLDGFLKGPTSPQKPHYFEAPKDPLMTLPPKSVTVQTPKAALAHTQAGVIKIPAWNVVLPYTTEMSNATALFDQANGTSALVGLSMPEACTPLDYATATKQGLHMHRALARITRTETRDLGNSHHSGGQDLVVNGITIGAYTYEMKIGEDKSLDICITALSSEKAKSDNLRYALMDSLRWSLEHLTAGQ